MIFTLLSPCPKISLSGLHPPHALVTPVTGERRGMITKRVRLKCSTSKHSQEVQRGHCSPFTAGTFLQMVENKPHNTSYTSLAEWNGVTVTPLGHWIILNADIFPAMFSTLKSACIWGSWTIVKISSKDIMTVVSVACPPVTMDFSLICMLSVKKLHVMGHLKRCEKRHGEAVLY